MFLFLSNIGFSSELGFKFLNIPYDKIFHVIVYMLFSILFYMSFQIRLNKYQYPKTLIIIVLTGYILGIATELIQSLNPLREFSFYDIIANSFGITIGSIILIIYLIFTDKKNKLK